MFAWVYQTGWPAWLNLVCAFGLFAIGYYLMNHSTGRPPVDPDDSAPPKS